VIGFFEHQYLAYKKKHLKNLIALARIDEEFHESELKLIYKLGRKYGLKDRQMDRIISDSKDYELYIPEQHDERMSQLYDLMLLVYADGVVEEREVNFCKVIAKKFGYDALIISWLIDLFEKGEEDVDRNWEEYVEIAEEFKQH